MSRSPVNFSFTIIALTSVLASLVDVVECRRVKRNVLEFHEMVRVATRRDPVDFYGYGNYCGLGGHGAVLDQIDLCCKQHDDCYAEQKFAHCGIFVPKYSWAMTPVGLTCLDPGEDFCDRHLCECDKAISECFAENIQFYQPSLTRTVHSIAYHLSHILEPVLSFLHLSPFA